jgi:ribonuclease HII
MADVLVCGVDEAGRGPLAGPVYAAAVILDPARRINGLADSKVLSPEKRETLAARIKERASAWSVASASVEEIDRLNIFHASMLAMRRAVEGLGTRPEEAWIDGNQCPRELPCRARAFVDGDAKHRPISAASILAKTARDAEMVKLSAEHPGYGFERHKGYATGEHLDALGRHGPCAVHRRSFQAIGVFFHQDLFTKSWSSLVEPLRVRSYRFYCEAMQLAAGGKLVVERGQARAAAARSRLAKFDEYERCLRRDYADVIGCAEASFHVALVDDVLRKARAELRAQLSKAS